MSWLPFICLGFGATIGFSKWANLIIKYVDIITYVALIILMLTIGSKIGSNDMLIENLGLLGFRCLFIAAMAICFSIIFTLLLEKTILPLDKMRHQLIEQKSVKQEVKTEEEKSPTCPLVWIIPVCVIVGIIIGHIFISHNRIYILDYSLMISLIILYIGVGISFGLNRGVFRYIRLLGWKVILISVAILIGSLVGGLISGIVLKMPIYITVASAGGMSYYSITGAVLTQAFGIETGAYGFLVNVMREFLTVLFIPIIAKISKGSTIASGAAGNMDTMLVPVTKFVGVELGLVALITGTILTFLVPFLLPILINIYHYQVICFGIK